uniref:Uncharacterized protein n=1 Tax=Siphoviridae sp. ctJ0s2 TaxID=2827834 RepID=A0A8S5TE60_9CAUD|nr:MAG TPA: hypothetical protein [Siphoviridae sp. ctJ0s2]DAX19963.1 MAG TPA: hypothetical protein [Caudoviricetes sp.]
MYQLGYIYPDSSPMRLYFVPLSVPLNITNLSL